MDELARFIGAFAVAAGFLGWLAKQLMTHLLSKDLEAHKGRLTAQHDRELERLRADLQVLAKEQEIRFAALHAKRESGIVELFEALQRAFGQLATIAYLIQSGARPPRAFVLDLYETNKAVDLFRANILYLDKPLADRVQKYLDEIRGIRATLKSGAAEEPIDQAEAKELFSYFEKNRAGLRENVFGAIELQFRRLLGSEQ